MTKNTLKLVTLEELIESKERKVKELAFYREKLLELEEKMHWIQKDIDVTNTIIEMIEEERVMRLEPSYPVLGKPK